MTNEQVFDRITVTRPADQVGDRRAAMSHHRVSGSLYALSRSASTSSDMSKLPKTFCTSSESSSASIRRKIR